MEIKNLIRRYTPNFIKNFYNKIRIYYRNKYPLKYLSKFINDSSNLEREINIIKYFSKGGQALDIGGNIGVYSFYMLKHFNKVTAFEPIPDFYNNLKKMFSNNNNYSVYNIALSDKEGEATIYIPDRFHGWSTLESDDLMLKKASATQKIKQLNIKTKTLDCFEFKDLDFVKIDVEGHELNVLYGAELTLKTNNAVILIEIEERHKKGSILNVVNYLKNFNYDCYFYFNNRLVSFDEFDFEIHHNDESENYIYNFIFAKTGFLDIVKLNSELINSQK